MKRYNQTFIRSAHLYALWITINSNAVTAAHDVPDQAAHFSLKQFLSPSVRVQRVSAPPHFGALIVAKFLCSDVSAHRRVVLQLCVTMLCFFCVFSICSCVRLVVIATGSGWQRAVAAVPAQYNPATGQQSAYRTTYSQSAYRTKFTYSQINLTCYVLSVSPPDNVLSVSLSYYVLSVLIPV